MVYIFHGDNQSESRSALNQFLSKLETHEIFKTDNKEFDLDKVNVFIHGQSLFANKKILVISNFFSIHKATIDKFLKTFEKSSDGDLIIWQDKTLTATQLKTFPKAKIEIFKLDNKLFACLNSIKPKNIKGFIPLYEAMLKQDLYDLFLYMLKNSIRKQMTTYSKFNQLTLKRTYLQLIELDFQNKTGQLAIPKEMALERILLNLMK